MIQCFCCIVASSPVNSSAHFVGTVGTERPVGAGEGAWGRVCQQVCCIITFQGANKLAVGLMHDDVLLINFSTKPRIQNANVFPKDRN